MLQRLRRREHVRGEVMMLLVLMLVLMLMLLLVLMLTLLLLLVLLLVVLLLLVLTLSRQAGTFAPEAQGQVLAVVFEDVYLPRKDHTLASSATELLRQVKRRSIAYKDPPSSSRRVCRISHWWFTP